MNKNNKKLRANIKLNCFASKSALVYIFINIKKSLYNKFRFAWQAM